jgi:phage tail-like protein
MAEARLTDPVANFRFLVVSPRCRAGFSKVGGIKEESDVIEYREGNQSAFLEKFPGLRKYPEMTFERGLTTESKALIEWRNAVIRCQAYKDAVSIQVQSCPGTLARSVNLPKSWPSALEISDLDAKASEIAIETMTLQHEGQPDFSALGASIFR